MFFRIRRLATIATTSLLVLLPAGMQAATDPIILKDGLLIRPVGRGGRVPFHTDAIEASIVRGDWRRPTAGATVTTPAGTNQTWEVVSSAADGWFRQDSLERGSYVYFPFVSDSDQILLLQARGNDFAYVNGELRPGDPYAWGNSSLPIPVHRGTNDLLFGVSRGQLNVQIATPAAAVQLDARDSTLPDILRGNSGPLWGAVLVVNAATNTLAGLQLVASFPDGSSESTPIPSVLPMSTRKVGFRLKHSGKTASNRVDCTLQLIDRAAGRKHPVDQKVVSLRVRNPGDSHRETFVSDIDGSVQYYAITPARPLDPAHPAQALVLSTHGASVEAQGQAEAYAPKPWAHVVAPTNRRPYGFDWEDWGRRDALEVLEIAQQKLKTDPHQTYLTGHSMGGHGAWQLGVTFPDRFAAIAPSAGWISFFSYAGSHRDTNTNALRRLLQRAATPMDTLVLASNYLHHGIYILHGDADDNVPVSEARTMRDLLQGFHRDFSYHEQPGAGHWWGNACVDWPPIFDLFARHRIPADEAIRHIDFTTANVGISASSHWVTVEAQSRPLEKSRVSMDWDPNSQSFVGITENIAQLSLKPNVLPSKGSIRITLDGQSLTNLALPSGNARLWLARDGDRWVQAAKPAAALKGPHRNGPFKEAFAHRMQLVYATGGTPEENDWALRKARYDAEAFRYRGNGSMDVIPDTAFDPDKEPDRGVVLYGNADSNKAWPRLLGSSPVQVHRDRVKVGSREFPGTDLACLFLRPRPNSDIACVAAVTGTGLVGLRLTERVPYFLAGVAYPDCTVFGPEVLARGADGVRAAGFFGNDWSVEQGQFE